MMRVTEINAVLRLRSWLPGSLAFGLAAAVAGFAALMTDLDLDGLGYGLLALSVATFLRTAFAPADVRQGLLRTSERHI